MQRHDLARSAAALLLLGSLAGCSDDGAPIRLGFVGGLSGGNADLGQAGRNGAMLAVEEANRSGGVRGRPIELVIRDDGNNAETAAAAAADLAKQKVAAIVGPFTTAMAEAVRTVTEPKKLLVFSPTASATQFSGLDDYFFRLCSTTAHNAEDYAEFMASRRGYLRVSLAIDKTNLTFASNFIETFKKKYETFGGNVLVEEWEDFHSVVGFRSLINRMLKPNPDAVFFIANAVDVARLAQQFRNMDTSTKIIAVEWAGTQQLIELGGKAVDGVEVLQLFNRFGQEERFLGFVKAYEHRFDTAPSFSSIIAYEVVGVLLKALEKRKNGDDMKDAVLYSGPYIGLQQKFTIDSFGDSRRISHFVVVHGAEFAPAP